MNAVIQMRGVSKRFRVRKQRPFLTREISRVIFQRASSYEEFTALRKLSFEVRRGESIGVIGRNGSGKTTLLSLIARTTCPSDGDVVVDGRVGPLLELGAGFHPDLTGHENILLNAALLGLTRREAMARRHQIVEFADIGEFIDAPLGAYSTGMKARLGFAVVAHADADILLVDEVFSVGDQQFQAKCQEVMSSARKRGVTMLVVSHGLDVISRMCERTILLSGGCLVADGATEDVGKMYESL